MLIKYNFLFQCNCYCTLCYFSKENIELIQEMSVMTFGSCNFYTFITFKFNFTNIS